MSEFTPRQIVEELDRYIIGQSNAKKAVAVALRNRLRRKKLTEDMQNEIYPKNILMIGPTGVGKTEIARRLAKIVNAPFIKIEATKFTEVGYVGRDVESMIRDLVEAAVRDIKAERVEAVKEKAEKQANLRLAEIIVPGSTRENKMANPFVALLGGINQDFAAQQEAQADQSDAIRSKRAEILEMLETGSIDNKIVEIEVEDTSNPFMSAFLGGGNEEMGMNLQDMFGNMFPKKRKKRKTTISEARKIIASEEAQKMVDMDGVHSEATYRVEQMGIVFLDEMDKIASRGGASNGPDVSREGVQRDILPLVEGSTVNTKYGPVKTDHILFIAAGAFHISKPSDLIPELQGRFPIRVELESLTKEDFKRILTEPKNALIKQYIALLGTEGVEIEFTEDAIDELAEYANDVNSQTENIGARRLHTILEKVLEELSFSASEMGMGKVEINAAYVKDRLKDITVNRDLSRYIL